MRRTKAPSQIYKSSSNLISKGSPAIPDAARSTSQLLNILANAGKELNHFEVSKTLDCSDTISSTISEDNTSTLPSNKILYSVVWGKQSKRKHKTWEGDGIIEVYDDIVVLKDQNGVVLGRSSKLKNLEEGSRAYIGSKEIEVINVMTNIENYAKTNNDNSSQIVNNSGCSGKNVTYNTENYNDTKNNFCKRPAKRLKKSTEHFTASFHNENYRPLMMPQTDYNHQWKYNKEKLPVTDVKLDCFLSRLLRPHQKEGVVFLYSCITAIRNINYNGAILADEMGLGKTLQCICLVWLALKSGPYGGIPLVKRALIVTPSSLVNNWLKEFKQWLGFERLQPYIVNKKQKPAEYLNIPASKQPVLIISYEMLVRHFEDIKKINFNLLICDEGHRLKNNQIRTSMLLSQLDIKYRIIVTGTPVQNDLQEFYALVDFVNPGILGSNRDFAKHFEEPIVSSNQPECDEEIRTLGKERANELNHLTNCFILRRTHSVIDKYLPLKQECVVFCPLTPLQIELIDAVVSFWEHSLLDISVKVPHLSIITIFKKICNDPRLLKLDKESSADNFSPVEDEEEPEKCLSDYLKPILEKFSIDGVSVELSSKMIIVNHFLSDVLKLKERVVLVSYFTQTLNLLEDLCKQNQYTFLRLDGNTPTSARQGIVEKFNSAHFDNFVFLLSAKAGGVGLNLTGASRLILFDLDWNPASDLQAMSRIWRDGQKKNVYIYRFLTAGTIEEKMYQRQISKTFLSNAVVDTQTSSNIRFSIEELKDLFTFKPDCKSLTHDLLHCNCDGCGIPDIEMNNKEENIRDKRDSQLIIGNEIATNRNISKISELMEWEHYSQPVPEDILEELCFKSAATYISFIFRNKCSEYQNKDDGVLH